MLTRRTGGHHLADASFALVEVAGLHPLAEAEHRNVLELEARFGIVVELVGGQLGALGVGFRLWKN